MIIPWLTFTERFKQSFLLIKKDFLWIVLYYLIFALIASISLSFVWNLIFSIAMKFANVDKSIWFDSNSYINMWYFAVIYWFITFSVMVLKIPFYISLIKNISDSYKWEIINKSLNLKYWFLSIWKIFNTYWYIFKYIALIPSVLLIVWLLVIFADSVIWLIIIVLSLFIFIYFSIFRWLRAYFSLFYAITNNDYSENSFKNSINLTKNNLWTIFLNILWFVIIFWIIWFIISKFINLSSFNTDAIYNFIYDVYINKNTDNIQEKVNVLISSLTPTNWSMIIWFFKNIIATLKDTLFYIFWLIFYFLLMKRFEIDKWIVKNTDNLTEVIEN